MDKPRGSIITLLAALTTLLIQLFGWVLSLWISYNLDQTFMVVASLPVIGLLIQSLSFALPNQRQGALVRVIGIVLFVLPIIVWYVLVQTG